MSCESFLTRVRTFAELRDSLPASYHFVALANISNSLQDTIDTYKRAIQVILRSTRINQQEV